MKKLISILGLSLGVGLSSLNAQEVSNSLVTNYPLKERIFDKIDGARVFDKGYYWEYSTSAKVSENEGEYVAAKYDFDVDGVPDVRAFFKRDSSEWDNDYPPIKCARKADIVFTDWNGDGKWDYIYFVREDDEQGYMGGEDYYITDIPREIKPIL